MIILPIHSYIFSSIGCENVYFELRSERVKNSFKKLNSYYRYLLISHFTAFGAGHIVSKENGACTREKMLPRLSPSYMAMATNADQRKCSLRHSWLTRINSRCDVAYGSDGDQLKWRHIRIFADQRKWRHIILFPPCLGRWLCGFRTRRTSRRWPTRRSSSWRWRSSTSAPEDKTRIATHPSNIRWNRGHLDFESAVTAQNDEFKAVLIARIHAC